MMASRINGLYQKNLSIESVCSPLGNLFLLGNTEGICHLMWDEEFKNFIKSLERPLSRHTCPIVSKGKSQIEGFFQGKRKQFDIPLSVRGTPFQIDVWSAIKDVDYAQTITYGQIAAKLGNINKCRAVGGALGKNPLPIFLPCHRVVAAHGALGGYSGGDYIKQWLLDFENRKNH